MQAHSMPGIFHWLAMHATLLAVIITAGVALLLVSCLGCAHCPCREQDELFKRREV
jgi:hypothetical protein